MINIQTRYMNRMLHRRILMRKYSVNTKVHFQEHNGHHTTTEVPEKLIRIYELVAVCGDSAILVIFHS